MGTMKAVKARYDKVFNELAKYSKEYNWSRDKDEYDGVSYIACDVPFRYAVSIRKMEYKIVLHICDWDIGLYREDFPIIARKEYVALTPEDIDFLKKVISGEKVLPELYKSAHALDKMKKDLGL